MRGTLMILLLAGLARSAEQFRAKRRRNPASGREGNPGCDRDPQHACRRFPACAHPPGTLRQAGQGAEVESGSRQGRALRHRRSCLAGYHPAGQDGDQRAQERGGGPYLRFLRKHRGRDVAAGRPGSHWKTRANPERSSPDQSYDPGFSPRPFLISPRRCLLSRRRFFDASVGRVGRRGLSTSQASRISSTSRSSASSRLRRWLR